MDANANVNIDELVRKVKDNLLSILVVGLCVMFAMKMYKAKQAEIETLTQSKEVELEKNKVLQEISLAEKTFTELHDKINTKDKTTNSVMYGIGAIAKELGVKILFIKPAGEEKNTYYTRFPYDLSVSVSNYHKLGKFISRIEAAPERFTVENFQVTPTADDSISARLLISTVQAR
ncbi:MAG: type 4a pilus biogenesis protein PilO [Deltaproteobacteria bacterium]